MGSGTMMIGKCDVCKEANVYLARKYFRYDIDCSCCNSNYHFISVNYCNNCEPKEPHEIRISLLTGNLQKI